MSPAYFLGTNVYLTFAISDFVRRACVPDVGIVQPLRKQAFPQASVEANVICTSVSDRKVRFLLEEAVLQDAWYTSAWLVGFSLSGEGMGK